MGKSKVFLILGGIFLMSSAFAEQKEGNSVVFPDPPFGKTNVTETSKRLDSVEQKVNQITETKISDVLGGKNPSFYGCHGDVGFFTNLSVLAWKAFNNSWLVALERRSPYVTSTGNEYSNIVNDEVDFDWSVGLRTGLGYNSGYDDWNVQGIYTWIRFSGAKSFVAKEFENLADNITLGIIPNDNYTFDKTYGFFRTLTANWRLNHNVGDLQFGRDFFITKALDLQPLLGVRFASLYQSMNAHFGENISTRNKYFSYHINHDFWGIGPKIGIDSKWTFPHNVGFTGLLTGAILYGQESVKEYAYGTPVRTYGPFELVGMEKTQQNIIVPTIQLALGLDWGTFFNKDTMYWGFNIAWELNYWWDQSNFGSGRIIQGPVEMQGISIRTDYHF